MTEEKEKEFFLNRLNDDFAIWSQYELDRAKELGLIDDETAAYLAPPPDFPPFEIELPDEKTRLSERLNDEFALWSRGEIERAKELGLVDDETASELPVVEDCDAWYAPAFTTV